MKIVKIQVKRWCIISVTIRSEIFDRYYYGWACYHNKDENDKTVNSLSNSDNILSESGQKYNGKAKVQYAAEFDELLDLKGI